ncbi:XdhC family protein [Hyphomicrobium sp. 2TAF46]|uniref:XdhC family protein n=1 Tax=Hyphomicrobium sp. 2TAF46 TaxID=3233019 RepID=UPI003F91865D
MTGIQTDQVSHKTGAPLTNPRAAARAWLEAGRPVAIATVIETWGSASVPPGGQMVIAGIDEFQGSVSGGPVEADVISAGLDVVKTGKPVTLSFGIPDEAAQRAGLACGGKIRIYVARLDPKTGLDLIRRLEDAAAKRAPVVVTTHLSDGAYEIHDGRTTADPAIAEAVRRARSAVDKSGDTFVHAFTPPPRIVIVGATHIAQHLATMATAAGYEVKVLDPRTSFANAARFDASQIVARSPKEAFEKTPADPFTAVVTLSHVGQIDDEALTIALNSPCRYIGSLGSRRTHAKRVERLKAAGFTDAAIARINAPVGLDIKAETPGEIATSILAQIISAFRKVPE